MNLEKTKKKKKKYGLSFHIAQITVLDAENQGSWQIDKDKLKISHGNRPIIVM
jgi:hypothetical protein